MKFEPTYQERSYCFVIPSFAQYFNEQVAKIYFHLHVNKAFPQALNSFDLDYMFFCVCVCAGRIQPHWLLSKFHSF